jgi:TRAP-type uncharacterized transport system substrate-binding protein
MPFTLRSRRLPGALPAAITAAVLVAAVAATWITVRIVKPTPPRTVVFSTGPAGSAYEAFGARYRAILAREGIEVRLLPSAGSVENLERLRGGSDGVRAAFVQAGLGAEAGVQGVESLGTVFFEPLWLFARGNTSSGVLGLLQSRRFSIDARGSGANALSRKLFAPLGVDLDRLIPLELPPRAAAAALDAGTIDVAWISAAWESQVIQDLLSNPELTLVPYPRADAIVARYPFLTRLVLPMGVADLRRNIPAVDTPIIAATTSLAVRDDLHPAVQFLLLDAMAEVHGTRSIFHRVATFPAPESIDLPLSRHARQYYKSGRPFLQRYLPFWIAVFVVQLLVVVVPLVAVLYPPLRALPSAYAWWMRRRVYRLYSELKRIEWELRARDPSRSAEDLVAGLAALEARASRLRVPASVAYLLYSFRDHLASVRARLDRRAGVA